MLLLKRWLSEHLQNNILYIKNDPLNLMLNHPVVVVVGLGELLAELLATEAGRHRKHPDVVPDSTPLWCHEVRDALALFLPTPDVDLLLSDSVQGPPSRRRTGTTHM